MALSNIVLDIIIICCVYIILQILVNKIYRLNLQLSYLRIENKFIESLNKKIFLKLKTVDNKYKVKLIILCLFIFMGGYFTNKLYLFLVGCFLFIIVPKIYSYRLKQKKIKLLEEQLPSLLELLSVCVQTGMTIEAAITYLSIEIVCINKELAFILQEMEKRSQLVGLDRALDDFYMAHKVPAIYGFIMTLKQSLQYGTAISDLLVKLAQDLRNKQLIEMEEKNGKLAAKVSIPLIIFIMLPVIILIIAPGFLRIIGELHA